MGLSPADLVCRKQGKVAAWRLLSFCSIEKKLELGGCNKFKISTSFNELKKKIITALFLCVQ